MCGFCTLLATNGTAAEEMNDERLVDCLRWSPPPHRRLFTFYAVICLKPPGVSGAVTFNPGAHSVDIEPALCSRMHT